MGTPSGLVAPSWLPSPPSRRCGSPSRSSMKSVPLLSTANASKQQQQQPKTTATRTKNKINNNRSNKKKHQEFVCYREFFWSIQYKFLLFCLYSRIFFYRTRLALQNTKTAK